jgi:hypothetical protein
MTGFWTKALEMAVLIAVAAAFGAVLVSLGGAH